LWPAKPYLSPALVGFDDYTEWQDYVQALLSIKTWSNCFVFFFPARVNCFVFFFLHMGWTFCLSKCPKSSWGKIMLGKVPPHYTGKIIRAGLWVFWNQHNNSEAQKSRVMPQEQGVPRISVQQALVSGMPHSKGSPRQSQQARIAGMPHSKGGINQQKHI
jgi:hypothetical protein